MKLMSSDRQRNLASIDMLLPADIVASLQIAIVLEYVNGGSLGDILQKVCCDATQSI